MEKEFIKGDNEGVQYIFNEIEIGKSTVDEVRIEKESLVKQVFKE